MFLFHTKSWQYVVSKFIDFREVKIGWIIYEVPYEEFTLEISHITSEILSPVVHKPINSSIDTYFLVIYFKIKLLIQLLSVKKEKKKNHKLHT